MCGIAGIIGASGAAYGENVARMLRAISYRGPDGQGTATLGNCVLGHVRLSIVDIGGSAQPMLSPDRLKGVSFNGEIYGYKRLRKNYRYPFASDGDTELLLAMYDRHGKEFVSHLPGMFAFALWDSSTQTLICARDRFGEKPLYYAWGRGGEFIFSSE